MKHGKKYLEAAKQVDRAALYDPTEAIALVKKTATAVAVFFTKAIASVGS